MTTTAIIGAGLTGALTALRLADAGQHVVIFEAAAQPLQGASFVNEGKIHMGYTYAGDPSLRTARRLIDGGLRFKADLAPWIAEDVFQTALTEGVDYLVPSDSQCPADTIRTHFHAVTEHWQAMEEATGRHYLGAPLSQGWSELDSELYGQHRPDLLASFASEEKCVDAQILAQEIRQALAAHPKIDVHVSSPVTRGEDYGGKWWLHVEEQTFGPFDTVVNASWQHRLKVDEASGFSSDMTWITRFKCTVDFKVPADVITSSRFRNFTCVLGAYGDAIFFPTGRAYLSWYPSGLLLAETSPSPKTPQLTDAVRAEVFDATFSHLSSFLPEIESLRGYAAPDNVQGGFIVAPGHSDITDPKSRLHERHEPGCHRLAPGYLSIDTGKYALAPALACECATLILDGGAG